MSHKLTSATHHFYTVTHRKHLTNVRLGFGGKGVDIFVVAAWFVKRLHHVCRQLFIFEREEEIEEEGGIIWRLSGLMVLCGESANTNIYATFMLYMYPVVLMQWKVSVFSCINSKLDCVCVGVSETDGNESSHNSAGVQGGRRG